MRDRSKNLWSICNVRNKVTMCVLLFSVAPLYFVHPANSGLATTDSNVTRSEPSTSTPLQAVGRTAVNEMNNDGTLQDSSWREVHMMVTGYCPCRRCCGKSSNGVTASGHRINRGDEFVAADRKYPFGTRVVVPGYNSSKPVQVLDRGNAICGNRLDVFFTSHREARDWGIRLLPVKVQVK
jgi:3D (Asp-Asp-Asp) domain-containing protein